MGKIAVYPGSFDPVTLGHLDLIQRASLLFDNVIVAVTVNPSKQCAFSLEERVAMVKKAAPRSNRIRVESFSGLLVDYVREKKACAIIRGLRVVSDFEFEFQMALMNRHLAKTVETVFLMPDERYTYLSSKLLKEIARLGGNTSSFLPKAIQKQVLLKLQ